MNKVDQLENTLEMLKKNANSVGNSIKKYKEYKRRMNELYATEMARVDQELNKLQDELRELNYEHQAVERELKIEQSPMPRWFHDTMLGSASLNLF